MADGDGARVMREIAAYLLIVVTLAGIAVAWWFSRRRNRRDTHSVRYVVHPRDDNGTGLPVQDTLPGGK
jgi:hypothetical protein